VDGCIVFIYSKIFFSTILSAASDVPVPLDSEVSVVTSSILRISSKVLIEVGPRACL
jgi:hypothetical protein